jgi:hypothetical protein
LDVDSWKVETGTRPTPSNGDMNEKRGGRVRALICATMRSRTIARTSSVWQRTKPMGAPFSSTGTSLVPPLVWRASLGAAGSISQQQDSRTTVTQSRRSDELTDDATLDGARLLSGLGSMTSILHLLQPPGLYSLASRDGDVSDADTEDASLSASLPGDAGAAPHLSTHGGDEYSDGDGDDAENPEGGEGDDGDSDDDDDDSRDERYRDTSTQYSDATARRRSPNPRRDIRLQSLAATATTLAARPRQTSSASTPTAAATHCAPADTASHSCSQSRRRPSNSCTGQQITYHTGA